MIRLCTAEGVDLDPLTWTDDPAAARAMLDDGTACHIAVARPDHFREVYPELMVATPPRHRPGGPVAAGLLAGLAAVGRRLWEHKVATAATVAMVGAMTAWPMLSPDLPELVPPVAAPPPLEVFPDLPAPEPEPPEPEAEPPAAVEPAPVDAPEMQPVAVDQPALPELPAAPIPRATPPAPIPAPEPPGPTPDPTEPPEPPALVDQAPLCVDLGVLGLVELRLCLLP